MSIHDLTASLDLKQNLNIYATCKQLDTLNLIFNIYDNSVQANLTNYDVRLKAMKADNVPLIQEYTGITILGNVVTILAHEQLTTTSGKTLIELQFIEKTTGYKKATFNLVLIVNQNTIEVNATISTATYTLLQELENKLDQASDFLENIDEAIEANDNLTATLATATTTNADLEANISTANTLITNGTALNNSLDANITEGTTLDSELDAANTQATANIAAMGSFGDVTVLSQTVAEHTEQLSENASNYTKFEYPPTFTMIDEFKIDLFKFGGGYNTNFDIRSKKIRNGGKTYYVAVNGSDTNDGLTIGTPLKDINTAIAKSDVNTIILLEGDYRLATNYINQILINKSLNIIGKGKVRIIHGSKITWTPHETYPNVYQVLTPVNSKKIISLNKYDENGDELELTRKYNVATEVSIIQFSYAIGSNVYVNLEETVNDDNIALLTETINSAIAITDSVSNNQVKVYMENIQIIGGLSCIALTTQTAQTLDNYLYSKDCKFMHAITTNGISTVGSNSVFVNCISSRNKLDGFNYHYNTSSKTPKCIEINCIGRNNGSVVDGYINNGTTMHDGGKALRVNCEYYGNQGGNISDIYANTQSVNLNCKTHDSTTIYDLAYNSNFTCHTMAEMWVFDSLSYGSQNDCKVEEDSILYLKNNQLLVGQNNISGDGQIINIQ